MVLSASLLATSAVARTIQAVAVALPSWHLGAAAHLAAGPWSTALSIFGLLAFLGAAWRLESAMRFRATGWTWALAGALVLTVGWWHLWAGPTSTLAAYAIYAPLRSLALVSYAIAAALTAAIAVPCLLLWRRLRWAGAPAVSFASERPPHVRAFFLHAAALESRLGLALGMAVLECASRLGSHAGGYGWERIFAAGDVGLDLLTLFAMAPVARDAPGPRWLVAAILLRTPLLIDARDQADWHSLEPLAFPGALVAIVGHYRFSAWLYDRLQPYCSNRTRVAYRDATLFLVAALLVLTMATFVLRTSGLFLVVAAPTAIVGVRLLRRHVEAALAVLKEADGSAPPRGG